MSTPHPEWLSDKIASSLAISEGYDPNDNDPSLWPAIRDRYRRHADAVLDTLFEIGVECRFYQAEGYEAMPFDGYLAQSEAIGRGDRLHVLVIPLDAPEPEEAA